MVDRGPGLPSLSARLGAVLDALPLRPGLRVLEIGGAPGTLARAIAARIDGGHILVIDRSPKGVAQVERHAATEIAAGRLSVRCVAAEDFSLEEGELPYDLAVAIRVGALDGRHPHAGDRARRRISDALRPSGRLLTDGGNPLHEVPLPRP